VNLSIVNLRKTCVSDKCEFNIDIYISDMSHIVVSSDVTRRISAVCSKRLTVYLQLIIEYKYKYVIILQIII